jgi:hypothetical protein
MKLRLILSILLITISTSAFFAQNNPTLLIDNAIHLQMYLYPTGYWKDRQLI